MRIRQAIILVLTALSLSSCAWYNDILSDPFKQELEQIVSLLPGKYSGSAPNPRQPDQTTILYHTLEQVDEPSLGQLVFHHVISVIGFEDEKPLQQKFYIFDLREDRNRNSMQSIAMLGEKRWTQGAPLDERAMLRFPEACAIQWSKDEGDWIAKVTRGTCIYESRAFGGKIEPALTYILSQESLSLQDLLYRAGGELLTPDSGFMVAKRVN